MGLIGNYSVNNRNPDFQMSGAGGWVGTIGAFHKTNRRRNIYWMMEPTASVPDGYDFSSAFVLAQKDGGIGAFFDLDGSCSVSANGISARNSTADLSGSGTISSAALTQLIQIVAALLGSSSLSADLTASAALQAALSGSGSLTSAQLSAIIPIVASIAGSCSLSPALRGIGGLEAEIVPFTELSPENLALQLLDSQEIESNFSLREALRLMLSALAGKLSGAATTTVSIRDINDSKNRIVATVDSDGNRTAVTTDVS